MRRVHATWQELIGGVFFVDGSETRVSRSVSHFVFFLFVLGFLRLRGDFSYDDDAGAFLHLIDGGLSPPRAQEQVQDLTVKVHVLEKLCFD
ncbi:hypothetical protein F2Q69_00014971 [Brassica cretica]|uniref:Uncharacterized protein n=1 Tax=Brassica cretica TaxID=69181 RepID=A0A8S9R8G7_BRACR|nr:hypothetical protein F2Q69_00014971 [Brassica cretica]